MFYSKGGKVKEKKTDRFNMTLPAWLKDAAKKRADSMGVSLSEYVKDLMKKDIGYGNRRGD